jgi:hypothetical protein
MFEDWIDSLVYGLGAVEVGIKNGKFYKIEPKKKHTAEEIVYNGKVYQQGKRTVLKVGNDVFMSEPEKGEKFDAEKGLLICIVKAMGMKTTDFLYLAKTVKNVTKKKSK